jgi:hypothetical protein
MVPCLWPDTFLADAAGSQQDFPATFQRGDASSVTSPTVWLWDSVLTCKTIN